MKSNQQSLSCGCCWCSRMLLSQPCHVPVRELCRALLCPLLCCSSSGLLPFYTGASTTPTCPWLLIPLLCTITTGIWVAFNSLSKTHILFIKGSCSQWFPVSSILFHLIISVFVPRTDCDSPASFLCSYPVANISLMRNKKNVCTWVCVHSYYSWCGSVNLLRQSEGWNSLGDQKQVPVT